MHRKGRKKKHINNNASNTFEHVDVFHDNFMTILSNIKEPPATNIPEFELYNGFFNFKIDEDVMYIIGYKANTIIYKQVYNEEYCVKVGVVYIKNINLLYKSDNIISRARIHSNVFSRFIYYIHYLLSTEHIDYAHLILSSMEKLDTKVIASRDTTHKNRILKYSNYSSSLIKTEKITDNKFFNKLMNSIYSIITSSFYISNTDNSISKEKLTVEYLTNVCDILYKYSQKQDRDVLFDIKTDYFNEISKLVFEYEFIFTNSDLKYIHLAFVDKLYRCRKCKKNARYCECDLLCKRCGVIDFSIEDQGCYMVCNICGTILQDTSMLCQSGSNSQLNIHPNLTFTEATEQYSFSSSGRFNYKASEYFKNNINKLKGSVKKTINKEDLDKILTEITNQTNNTNKDQVDYLFIRNILKRLKLSIYYDNIYEILNNFFGKTIIDISGENEDLLLKMFNIVYKCWGCLKDDVKKYPKNYTHKEFIMNNRDNFFNYFFILYKFFEILGLNRYLKYIPMLKSQSKLFIQDIYWKYLIDFINNNKQYDPFDIEWTFKKTTV